MKRTKVSGTGQSQIYVSVSGKKGTRYISIPMHDLSTVLLKAEHTKNGLLNVTVWKITSCSAKDGSNPVGNIQSIKRF